MSHFSFPQCLPKPLQKITTTSLQTAPSPHQAQSLQPMVKVISPPRVSELVPRRLRTLSQTSVQDDHPTQRHLQLSLKERTKNRFVLLETARKDYSLSNGLRETENIQLEPGFLRRWGLLLQAHLVAISQDFDKCYLCTTYLRSTWVTVTNAQSQSLGL